MPTNESESTADREYYGDQQLHYQENVFRDMTHPIVGAWLIGICLMLTVAVIIAALVHWAA